MTYGITTLYHRYLHHLRGLRDRLSVLQLTGRMEDYLVKEFAVSVHQTTKGHRFVYTNAGRAGEQKVDLALMRFGSRGKPEITAFVEAKYLRNRHRLSRNANGARDEDQPTLKSLAKQLKFRPARLHSKMEVHLASKTTLVYGLVFASYTRNEGEKDDRKEYYQSLLERAAKHRLVYYDLSKPYWGKIYEEQPIKVFGERWYCSLRAGLWRTRSA